MDRQIIPGLLKGIIKSPSSKSDGQRALLCASLARGTSQIKNLGNDDDDEAMLRNIKILGAKVTQINTANFEVRGDLSIPGSFELNTGESGLGLRLLTSVISAFEGKKRINGKGSILNREHSFFSQILPTMGVNFSSKGNKLPFALEGKMKAGNYTVDGSQSSQYISGLLMALPLLESDSVLKVEKLNSAKYVEMTIKTLDHFGVHIDREADTFFIKGNQKYMPAEYSIEGDWSSASYFLVASAIGHEVSVSGLNQKSLQADREILDAFDNANCPLVFKYGALRIDGSCRRAFSFDATHCPDLFPALTALAAYCNGTSIIKGVSRLKNKESDRGNVLRKEFGKLGLKIDLIDDEMHIHGGSELRSSIVSSSNDHRIAMCLAIAGIKIPGGIKLLGGEVVSKSYPQFWDDLTSLTPTDH